MFEQLYIYSAMCHLLALWVKKGIYPALFQLISCNPGQIYDVEIT